MFHVKQGKKEQKVNYMLKLGAISRVYGSAGVALCNVDGLHVACWVGCFLGWLVVLCD